MNIANKINRLIHCNAQQPKFVVVTKQRIAMIDDQLVVCYSVQLPAVHTRENAIHTISCQTDCKTTATLEIVDDRNDGSIYLAVHYASVEKIDKFNSVYINNNCKLLIVNIDVDRISSDIVVTVREFMNAKKTRTSAFNRQDISYQAVTEMLKQCEQQFPALNERMIRVIGSVVINFDRISEIVRNAK